ncbi:hypothetical protein IAU59_001019 [Kwoniella sp. CBS 9459]
MARQTPILGLSERWSLARNNVGSPITVIYHTSLPIDLISESDLRNALVKLCEVYPILVHGVSGKETSRPYYAKNEAINPRELVKMVELTGEGERRDGVDGLEALVQGVVKRGSQFDVVNGPMLEVQYHYPSTATSTTRTSSSLSNANRNDDDQLLKARPRARLVMIIDHVLCDGVGARNLFADLLNILSNDSASLPAKPEGLPARMDDTVDLRSPAPASAGAQAQEAVEGSAVAATTARSDVQTPGAGSSYLGKITQQVGSLVNRVLPQSAFAPPLSQSETATASTELTYPPKPPSEYNSITAGQQFAQFELSTIELSGLLSMSKNHSVGTVHPTIHVASLFALYRAHLQVDAQAKKPTDGTKSIKFTTSVPISERKENLDLGHPRSTGNYVIFQFSTDTVEADTAFWDHARSFGTELRRRENRQTARHTLGKLGDIEGGKGELNHNELGDEASPSPSKWEDYLRGLMSDPSGPHKLSLAVSNVGIMDLPTTGKLAGPGVVGDVYFTQAASAMGACVVLSIMSTRGGSLTVSFSSKKGSLPEGVFDNFVVQLKGLLQALARGDVSEDAVALSALAGVA